MRTITVMLTLTLNLFQGFQHLFRRLRSRTKFGMTGNHVQSNIMNYGNDKGIALVITLLVLALLMVIVLEFSSSMRVEARAAANFRDDMKAYYLAKSGVTFAIALLEEDKDNPDTRNVDSLNELWAQKIPPLPVGDGYVSVDITDESGKINVNKLAAAGEPGKKMRSLMARFLEQFELKGELVYNIADWIDQDKEAGKTIVGSSTSDESSTGAESSYYESLENPYEAKDNKLDSLEELRLIKDVDNDTFNKLRDFLTVVSSDGKININTARKEVLMSLTALSSEIFESNVDEIINSRAENPFQNVNDLASGTAGRNIISDGALGSIRNFITLSSNYFSITSTGEVNRNRKTIHAVAHRQDGKTTIEYWRVE